MNLSTAETKASGRRLRVLFAIAAVCCFVVLLLSEFSELSHAQRRRARRRPTVPATRRPGIDYSKFSHATTEHRATCNTCHKIPTSNWQKVRNYPDVADYPDHDACVSCHRPQFFRGARPPICSVCHSKVSPRDDARFAFRNPATQREFETEFPHDRHQDVIARLFDFERQLDERPASLFIRASFRLSPAQADEKAYNNCTICHAPRERLPAPPAGGWIDGLAPDNLTFKAVPANHASCFNCHWKSEAPTGNDCAGCHKLTTPHTAVDLPQRISMKFRHDGGGERKNHVAECTTCHINITKSATLRGLKPDVPVTACTECHNKDGLRLDVSNELVAIDKNRDFVCVYCHTSNIGKLDPPASHYLIAERPPKKRQDIR